MITGSGRLNLFQKGGDSLQGRYDLFHLLPITYDEWTGSSVPSTSRDFKNWEPDFQSHCKIETDLLRFGGFPQPLARGSEAFLNKWMDLYLKRLFEEDIRDLSRMNYSL